MRENFTYNGEWFLPQKPENKIPGILTYNPEEGIYLELMGSLRELRGPIGIGDLFKPDIILGFTTNGKAITLYRCAEIGREINFPGGVTTKNRVNYCFVGTHFDNASELKFDSLKVSFQNLEEWLNISGFKTQFDNKHNKQKLEFELPDPIVFDLGENLKGKFEFNSRYKSRPHKVSLEQNVYFVVESTNKELQFNDLLTKIWPFQNFLILATHSSCHTREIKLKNESPKEIEVFFERLNSQQKRNLKGTYGYLFFFSDIEVDFEKIIQKWYSMTELANPFINPLFDFLHMKKFDENVFLDIIQA